MAKFVKLSQSDGTQIGVKSPIESTEIKIDDNGSRAVFYRCGNVVTCLLYCNKMDIAAWESKTLISKLPYACAQENSVAHCTVGGRTDNCCLMASLSSSIGVTVLNWCHIALEDCEFTTSITYITF